ncbi:MAG TPA: acyl-CoA dehydrogenase family protein [Ilumatobacteraceae bacterium]|nr:acyl-CoA dehydrogenase family protein [Ilumatobacteraceae bacterium]
MPADDTATDQLLAAIEVLGPLWRQRMAEHDQNSTFPYENLAEATEAGLNRLTVPKEYGGFGYWMPGNFSGLYRLLERMAYWDTNTAQLVQVHNHAAGIIAFHSSLEQRDRFMPQIVKGAYLASLGSEAHLYENGAEALASELTAVDGGYRLTARKAFASVAAIAKYLMVWCAVEGDTAYAGRMVFAVVPTDAPGVTLLDDWHMLGMRSTVSCSVAFDNVFVPADDVVGEPGGWINNDPRTFSCGYASNHLGTAQGAFDFIANYVAGRDDLSSSEAVKVRLGRMDAQLFAARSALRSTAARLDRGDDPDECEADAIRTMHLAKNAVLDIPYQGFDIVGARAAHERYPLGQMMRDARTFTLHFRDDLYVQRLADMAMGRGFSAKKARSGSTPFDQSAAGA